ncbi:hypothetical protein Tco_1133254 [Tanacetum coccineum]
MVLKLVSVERWYEGGDCGGAWSDVVVMMAGVAWDGSGDGVDGEDVVLSHCGEMMMLVLRRMVASAA